MGTFSIYTLIALALVGAIIYVFVRALMRVLGVTARPVMACTTCGHIGASRSTTRGSIFIEIVLWLCFLVPGLIYSIWRITTRTPACESCKSFTVVPLTSPVGKRIAQERIKEVATGG